jgi:RimJ/RimL family protein N-acetyltransferase
VDFFHRLWSDERVAQTIGGVRQRAQVTQTVERSIEHWESHGFGRWVLLRDNAPVGTVKLEAWANDGAPEVELGYALLPGNWGVGYATEAAAGALEQARLLGLREVVAFALLTNLPSLAVIRRLGFDYERELLLEGGRHALYRRRA